MKYYINLVKYSDISGNAIKRLTCIKSATRNGNTPRYIVLNGVSAILFKTKRFIPHGGEIMPISIILTINTPNQIGSYPRDNITGKIIGIVIARVPITLIKAPRTM